MRLFRLRYNGYFSEYYMPEVYRAINPETYNNYFLSYAAAEAIIPPLNERDIRESQVYGENIRFWVEELDPYQTFETLFIRTGEIDPETNHWRRERFWTFYGNGMYPHPDPQDPRLVRFWDFNANRLTSMKPGKFLKKFFNDHLTDRQIAFYAEWWTAGERPKTTVTVKLATEKDDIQRVYNEGPQSCMKGSAGVVAYASGELAIAYGTADNGKIVCRALCWPERKIYGRIYPNVENWARDGFESESEAQAVRAALTEWFRSQGYESIQERPDGFDGAPVRLEPVPRIEGGVYMPYLDNGLALEATPDQKLVLKKDGPIKAASTGGYIQLMEAKCAVCSRTSVYSAGTPAAFNRVCRDYHQYNNENSRHWPTLCDEHLEEYSQTDHHTGQRFLKEGNTFVEVYRYNLENPATYTVLLEIFDDNRGWYSAKTGRAYSGYDVTPVYIDGKTYHPREVIYSDTLSRYFLSETARLKAERAARVRAKKFKATAPRPFVLIPEAA